MTDLHALVGIIRDVRPTEVYNLAAQSHVQVSFQMPMYTAEVDGVGTLNLLEAIRLSGQAKTCRFYQASTSELYGKVQAIPQDEETPFYPRSPYAVAKMMAYWAVVNYRESYDMYACNGILFNHESPRRGETFVTRKITLAVANIKAGKQECLYLGNMDAKRDWGHARDYVECMWKMLQQEGPDDFVVATGETNTVRHFVTEAFKVAGMELKFEGEGVNEVGIEVATGRTLVRVHERYFRPAEVDLLIGSPAKALAKLKWNPKTTTWSSSSRRWSRRTPRAPRTPPCASKKAARHASRRVYAHTRACFAKGRTCGRELGPTRARRRDRSYRLSSRRRATRRVERRRLDFFFKSCAGDSSLL